MTNYIGGKALDIPGGLPPTGETHHILIDEFGVLTTATPAVGGGGGSYTEVANKAALGSAATPGEWKKNIFSGVVYVSYANAWVPVGMAVTGTSTDQATLTASPTELELNMQFTVDAGSDQPVTSVWDGTRWIAEGP